MNLKPSEISVLRKLIFDNKYFIIPFILCVALTSILLGIWGNDRMFLYVNRYYSDSADILFLNLTNLGDGIVAAILVIILLWVSYRESLTFLAVTLILLVITTLLKNYIFPEMDRPLEYFGSSEVLRIVKGYDPPKLSTFPSGHAATAFSVCLYLSFLIRNRYIKLSLFLIAFFVGYSRVYLSAHFPADVLAGASIAVFSTILCYFLSRRICNSWIDGKIVLSSNTFTRERSKDKKYIS
jgi:membrane-associated phospholipid phosphatase